MTRKDYKALADVFATNKPSPTYPTEPMTVWCDLLRETMRVLKRDNPRFSIEKFIAAANGR